MLELVRIVICFNGKGIDIDKCRYFRIQFRWPLRAFFLPVAFAITAKDSGIVKILMVLWS